MHRYTIEVILKVRIQKIITDLLRYHHWFISREMSIKEKLWFYDCRRGRSTGRLIGRWICA